MELYSVMNAVRVSLRADLSQYKLRKKFSYSEFFWPVFSPNVRKYGPEYGHFSRSDYLCL